MKVGDKIQMTNYQGEMIETFISYVDKKQFSIHWMGKRKFDLSRWEKYFVSARNAKFIK